MLADKQNALGLGQSLGRLLSQVLGQFGDKGGGSVNTGGEAGAGPFGGGWDWTP